MMLSLDAATSTVRKAATTPAEADRLDREAAVLRVARHPGVVQLRSAQRGAIELSSVTGWCLSDVGGLRPAEVAGLGSAIATVLADLHDLGIVHGTLDASHVLLSSDGRPVLCSLGRARMGGAAVGPVPGDDALALVEILRSRLPIEPGRPGHRARGAALAGRWRRQVEAAATSDDVRQALRARRWLAWKRGPTTAELAVRLAALPGATLPDPARPLPARSAAVAAGPDLTGKVARPLPSSMSRRRWVPPVVGVVVAAAVILVASAGIIPGRDRPPLADSLAGCPKVDQGCRPVDYRGGVVVTANGRFDVVGARADPLVLGRWTCGPALPALLRLDRGEVWVWDRWPTGGSASAGRLAGRVVGADTLRVVAGASGCDRLSVIRRGRPAEVLTVNMS